VRNSDGTQVRLDEAFTPVAPMLAYVNSATKPSGNIGSTVIVEGDAFGDRQGTGGVFFSDGVGGTVEATIASADDWTNTFIVTTVPSSTESGDIVVQTATGTSDALTFTVTQNATFSPSTITWTGTTSLPVAVSGHQALFVPIEDGGTTTNYVHITGGSDSSNSPTADVNFATILPDGHLSAWTSITPLPEARAFHASVVATPFNSRVGGAGQVYVMGGISTAGGQPTSSVYRVALNVDGTIGAWQAVTSLPVPLHSPGAVVFRSAIYIAGGASTDNVPEGSIYRARIDSLGQLSDWETLSALPSAFAYHGFTIFGGYLHAFGGETAAVSPDDGNFTVNGTKLDQIVYMKINLRTGDLATATWTTNEATLVKAVSKHTAVVAGGNVLITAGLYNGAGTGSSENSYAQISSDGSVGSLQGATGAITIESQGGGNLFNHAALSYVDANGVAHVMVLGGDDVNNPGTKHAGVWFY